MALTGRALCVPTDRAHKAGDGGGHRPPLGTQFCNDVRVLSANIFEPSRTLCCTRPACGWSVLQASSHQNRCYALSSDQAWQTAHKRDALSNTNAPRIFAARPIPGPSCGTRVRWPCGLIPPRSRVGYWHAHTVPTPHTCHSSPQTPVRVCRHATRITRAQCVATVAQRRAQTRVSTPVTESECWMACSRASPSVVHGGIKLLGNVGSCLLHEALELAQGAAVASALAK